MADLYLVPDKVGRRQPHGGRFRGDGCVHRDTESRYARGAATLGLPEMLDRGVLEDAGQISMYLKRPGWAVWSFRRNVEKYPDWAGAHNNLANALLTVADTNGARKEFRTATDIGKRNGDTAAAEMAEAKLKALSTPVQAGKPKP